MRVCVRACVCVCVCVCARARACTLAHACVWLLHDACVCLNPAPLKPPFQRAARGSRKKPTPHTLLQLSQMQDTSNHTRQGSIRRRMPSLGQDPKFLSHSPGRTRSATNGVVSRSSSLKNRPGSRPSSGLYQRTVDSYALRRTQSNGAASHELTNSRPHSADEVTSFVLSYCYFCTEPFSHKEVVLPAK